MRLREVLDRPGLRLTLVTGTDADLDRPVRRVFTTDLLDPGRYLSGGELVLTGLMWRRSPADSDAFAANLAGRGITAVGAGEAALGDVPADLVDACERHGLALFRVPVDISFQLVTDEVSRSAWSERASGLATLLGRHRELVSAMARGARLADLLPSVAAEAGISCWVRSATGRLIAGTGALPATIGDRLTQRFLTADRLPCEVEADGRRFLLLPVIGRPEHRLTTWCLVCEAHPGTDHEELAEVADGLQNLVTLERAQHDRERATERRPADRLVRLLTTPGEPSDLRAALHACRLSADSTFLVVAAGLVTTRGGPSKATDTGVGSGAGSGSDPGSDPGSGVTAAEAVTLTLLSELLQPYAAHVAVGGMGDGAMAVLAVRPDDAAELIESLRAATHALGPCLGERRLSIGVNDSARGVCELPGAAEHARHAFRTAARRPEPAAVVSSADLASHLLLLAGIDTEARRAFRGKILGPLAEYDRTHRTDLVRTLDTFLDCSGSWNRCAQALHVHVNTLRYRLQRVEQLTGRDLGRFDDRVDFFLALRLPAG